MRLHEQLLLLENNFDKIKITGKQLPQGAFIIHNIKDINNGINELLKLPYLKDELQVLINLEYFYNFNTDQLKLDPDQYKKTSTYLRNLHNKMSIAHSIINLLIPDEDELTLNIKLPKYNSLHEMSNDLKLIDKILNQVLTHSEISSGYNFINFDVGSEWICLAIKTIAAYHLIAGIIWAACVIRKKKIEGDILVEQAKSLSLKNESIEDLVQAQKILLDTLTKSEAENLIVQNNIGNTDPEFFNRIIFAITQTADLINRGAEIHPALNTPEDSKNLFPDYNKIDLIESKIKLLEEDN